MKRVRRTGTVIALAAGLLLALNASSGRAGDYHRGAQLVCSDCHVMHYSTQHAYSGGAPGTLAAGGPFPHLLKASPSDLCLTCHDGAAGSGDVAPDVMQAAGTGQAPHRSAGAFQAQPGTQTANGHSLGVTATPPGGTMAMALSCASCHEPHGNGNYRNLVSNPGGVTGLAVTAVSQAQTTPTATQYDVGNVRYTGSSGGLAAWCAGCHGDYHGSGGAANMGGGATGDLPGSSRYWFRHPTTGVTMAQGVTNQHLDSAYWFSGALSRVPVVSASGAVPGASGSSDNEVFCGSCHKAHGSPHRAGVVWDDPATATPEDGTLMRQTCQTCHYQ